QFHVTTWCREPVLEAKPSLGRERNVHEEVDIAGNVALAQGRMVLGQLEQEVVTTVVHELLAQRVSHLIRLGRARATQRAVATARIGNDRQKFITALTQ